MTTPPPPPPPPPPTAAASETPCLSFSDGDSWDRLAHWSRNQAAAPPTTGCAALPLAAHWNTAASGGVGALVQRTLSEWRGHTPPDDLAAVLERHAPAHSGAGWEGTNGPTPNDIPLAFRADPNDPDGFPPALIAAFAHTADWTDPVQWSGAQAPLVARLVRQAASFLMQARAPAALDRWPDHPVWRLAVSNNGNPIARAVLSTANPPFLIHFLQRIGGAADELSGYGLAHDPEDGLWSVTDPHRLVKLFARRAVPASHALWERLQALPGLRASLHAPDTSVALIVGLIRERCYGPAARLLAQSQEPLSPTAAQHAAAAVPLAAARSKSVPADSADHRPAGERTARLLDDLWARWGVPDTEVLRAVLRAARVSNPDAPVLLDLVLRHHHPQAPSWDPDTDDALLLATGLTKNAVAWLEQRVAAGWDPSGAAWDKSGMSTRVEARAVLEHATLDRVGGRAPGPGRERVRSDQQDASAPGSESGAGESLRPRRRM